MNQITIETTPPLPVKTRRSPPGVSQTVLTSAVNDDDANIYQYTSFPEPERSHNKHSHVVKIRISPSNTNASSKADTASKCDSATFVCESVSPCIRISVNADTETIQNSNNMHNNTTGTTNGYFYYGPYMSSGQVSPSDTLDSGTCSDLDGTPPPLPKKKNGVSVTLISMQHKRASSLTSSGAEVDSDDNDSNLSCDSLNSGKMSPSIDNINKISPSIDSIAKASPTEEIPDKTTSKIESNKTTQAKKIPPPPVIRAHQNKTTSSSSFLPQMLLQDIRQRNVKLSPAESNRTPIIDEKSYEERKEEEERKLEDKKLDKINYELQYETDKFYKFHLNEHVNDCEVGDSKRCVVEDETFAGVKNLLGDDQGTIRSAKGTVRGVKNRVRAGIATFLQINDTIRSYKEKDAGKVVVYSTTMGIIRETYQACMKVKKIMRTLLVKFEERDVFMSTEYQTEIKERMRCDYILVPQVFVDGQHIGDAETIERLNESGELRKILKPYKTMDACTLCKVCGGFRLLPCSVCNGSKKSVHRNHFTAEFVALKCMNCDEVGLVRCNYC